MYVLGFHCLLSYRIIITYKQYMNFNIPRLHILFKCIPKINILSFELNF